MNIDKFLREFRLEGRALAISRIKGESPTVMNCIGCALKELNKAFSGETIIFGKTGMSCKGAQAGFGFSDDLPNIPGGFGKFLTSGAGEGYPAGERVKCSESVAEAMINNQPKKPMEGFDVLKVSPLKSCNDTELVAFLVNPDQLSALVHLYNYRKSSYDQVIVPMSAGCASIFRIPFGEMLSGRNRAVVGNADVFSRPHFPADTMFFIVDKNSFEEMLADADSSFLSAPIWQSVKKRLHNQD